MRTYMAYTSVSARSEAYFREYARVLVGSVTGTEFPLRWLELSLRARAVYVLGRTKALRLWLEPPQSSAPTTSRLACGPEQGEVL